MRLLSHLAVTAFIGVMAAAVALSSGFSADLERSALAGIEVGTLLGVLVLLLRARLVARAGSASGAMARAILAQTLAFLARLFVVGAGAFVVADSGASPVAFVVAFLAVYFGQQVVELRYMVSAPPGTPQGT